HFWPECVDQQRSFSFSRWIARLQGTAFAQPNPTPMELIRRRTSVAPSRSAVVRTPWSFSGEEVESAGIFSRFRARYAWRMPDNQDSSWAGARAALDSSDPAGESASDEPDQPDGAVAAGADAPAGSARRSFLRRLIPRTPTFRFLSYVRPHLWLVAGGSVMGVLKFGLPLAFPLAFKYVFDVLLVPQPHVERVNRLIDRWCLQLAAMMRLGSGTTAKLGALTAGLFVLFLFQAVATYYRNYWASTAWHRLIFDLSYALFLHMQRLYHSFFDRNASGGIVSRFISDIQLAQNFVGSAMINIWMDGISLGLVIWMLFMLDVRLAWISLIVVPFYVAVIRVLSP